MNPYSLDPVQDIEVSYISGVGADGTLAAQSFWTWNGAYPAAYGQADDASKWGSPVAGTPGTVTYTFAAASNWSPAEQQAFQAGMALWSAEAGVSFEQVSSGAEFTIVRGADGAAETSFTVTSPGSVGGAHLGTQTGDVLSIDTSVPGFGPIGAALGAQGGAPWNTLEHELGHVIGLGHAGAYNEGYEHAASGPPVGLTSFDSLAYSLMSYIDPSPFKNSWAVLTSDGSAIADWPVTPMMVDILAAQRLYGLPASTPLSGGQVFGFHTNITGLIEPFFDFTQNTSPVVTLWDEGSGNVLDLSGFNAPSAVNLSPGGFTSAGGLTNNIAIGLGVQIDESIGGPGADIMFANSDGNTLVGGGGSDTLNGSYGHDLMFGNAGDDRLQGVGEGDTFYGGAGDDLIFGSGRLSGDLGDDNLVAGDGSTVSGGPGADTLQVADDVVIVDSRADLAGDIVYGLTNSDVIHVTDGASGDGYSLVNGGLDLGGDAILRLATTPAGDLSVAADPSGGVDVTITAPAAPPQGFDSDVLIPFRWSSVLGDQFFTERVGVKDGYYHSDGYTVNLTLGLGQSWQVQGVADFSGDGAPDLIWRNSDSGVFTVWDGAGEGFQENTFISSPVDPTWVMAGFGDFDGDGKADILWRNALSGVMTEWRATGAAFVENTYVDGSVSDTNWRVFGIADFNGDGKDDILWRNAATGMITEWRSTGSGFQPNVYVDGSVSDLDWKVAGTGDFNGDGKADLLWRNAATGVVTVWSSDGSSFVQNTFANASMDASQQVVTVGDLNADGRADIVWSSPQGDYTLWVSNGSGFDAHDIGYVGSGFVPTQEHSYGIV